MCECFPLTRSEYLRQVAMETARMSYPGSMSRGRSPVVRGGTKKRLEQYFTSRFPISEVWQGAKRIAADYDGWHKSRTNEIAKSIRELVAGNNDPMSVAAKFLNTFMHQLMKYGEARPLHSKLHLPLDKRVFDKLRRQPSLAEVREYLEQSPYSIKYDAHVKIQSALWTLVKELNSRPDASVKITSRIELNLLWV